MQETETVLSVIRDHPKLITGEPVTGKLVRRVREGADGKGPAPRAPRRRPTSLGKGEQETRPIATAPAPYFTSSVGWAFRIPGRSTSFSTTWNGSAAQDSAQNCPCVLLRTASAHPHTRGHLAG